MLDPSRSIAELLMRDRRYRLDAYSFVFDALQYAQEVLGLGAEVHSEASARRGREDDPPERHVTGQDLCEAIRQFALRQYGLMAKMVLESWGVNSTSDFGEIVFNLIRIGQMKKSPQDRREDFDDVYDFETAFRPEFRVTMAE